MGGSLRRTLATTSMATLATALLLAAAAFAAYELVTFRATMVRTLSAQAAIIAHQSTSALVFHDPESATATLTALGADPHVLSAAIYDGEGALFASHARDGARAPGAARPARPAGQGHSFERGRLVLSRPILFDGAVVGTVVIESDLEEMRTRLRRYGVIVAGVMAVSFVLAYVTGSRLQRAITAPILHLAATAEAVSRRDYTVRAASGVGGELGLLVRTFNHMLDQIEDRDAALQRARGDLERQVDERTRDLKNEVAENRALGEQLRRQNEDLEQQSRRAQEATRLKSEFLANMSHELRTPLNAIIGFAELMHDGKVGTVSALHQECLADILTSSRHLLQLINDVLDLSKIEAGKMEFRPERVEVARLVGEVRDILRGLSASKRITLSVDVDPALEVVLDPGKLKQVLYNYLSNALKFTPEGGGVALSARLEAGGRFRIEVSDTGLGIAPEDQRRLFVEFQQLDASASKAHAGTGLGLALTRRIVEAQGGTVGVSSRVGQGSTFFAVLPRLARAAHVDTLPSPLPRSAVARTTLLVIEDDARERAWLTAALSAAGYAVEGATSGREAIDKVARRAYDGITLDLLLPDMGGWDVLKAIRTAGPNAATPVIVVTVIVEKGIGAGYAIHDYLAKPVSSESLLASLRAAGARPSATRPVLVVDDDPQARRLMQTTLQAIGYSSVEADSAEGGLAVASLEMPAAVILDLAMPGMDGFEFLDLFRGTPAGRGTPVIVWTNKDLTAVDHGRLSAWAQAVVPKGGTARLLEELRIHVPLAAASAAPAAPPEVS
jgi:signal transduction histidine kinase/CheY-like chemotaxis protein